MLFYGNFVLHFQTYNHQLFFDRDTIIHTEQLANRTFCCHIYKMVQCPEDEDGNKD